MVKSGIKHVEPGLVMFVGRIADVCAGKKKSIWEKFLSLNYKLYLIFSGVFFFAENFNFTLKDLFI